MFQAFVFVLLVTYSLVKARTCACPIDCPAAAAWDVLDNRRQTWTIASKSRPNHNGRVCSTSLFLGFEISSSPMILHSGLKMWSACTFARSLQLILSSWFIKIRTKSPQDEANHFSTLYLGRIEAREPQLTTQL